MMTMKDVDLDGDVDLPDDLGDAPSEMALLHK